MIQSDGIWIAGGGGGWMDGWRNGWRGKKYGIEQNGSCPTHSWVGKHELFGELERERESGLLDNMMYVHRRSDYTFI